MARVSKNARGEAAVPELFEELLEAIPDGVVVADSGGRITFVNRETERMSGFSRKELLGQPVETLIPSDLATAHRGHRQRYSATPTTRSMGSGLNIRLRHKEGSEFPVDIALSPLKTNEGLLVIATIRDITQQQRAQQTLRESEERFRLLVDGVSDYALFMLDPQGRVVSWNAGAERIKGYPAEEVLGRHFSVFYPPEDVQAGKPQGELDTALQQGRFEDEALRVRKDGSRFWANVVVTPLRDEQGGLRGFAKITRDITERRQAQDELEGHLEVAQAILQGQAAESVLALIAHRARTLVGASLATLATPEPGGELIVRAADGAAAEAMRGVRMPAEGSISAHALRGGQAAVIADLAEDPGAYQLAVRAAGLGPALVVPLAVGQRAYGTLVLSKLKAASPFTGRDLNLAQLFAAQAAVALDYTRIREELQRLAVIEDRERIGRELHDGAIQSLFAVGMGLQAAGMRTADADLKARLDAAVKELDRVIRDLRNYIFGLRPGLLADRALDRALRELAEGFQARTDVTTVVDVDAGVAAGLTGQATDLLQMATEALANVGHHARATTCRLSLRRSNGLAVLEVEDDGQGFDPHHVSGPGQGLRNFGERAAHLGGRVDIESTPGEGTTVRISIPI